MGLQMSAITLARYPVRLDGETADVGDAEELVVLLDVLNGRSDREVLTQLSPHLPLIIRKPSDLPIPQSSSRARSIDSKRCPGFPRKWSIALGIL